MPIKLTYDKLLAANASGALGRFLSIRKTIAAAHKNRKLPAAIGEELKHLDESRLDLVKKHGGTLPSEGAPSYLFSEGKQADFERDFRELCAQVVELPGDQVKVGDLLDGGLLETDFDFLAPFLAE